MFFFEGLKHIINSFACLLTCCDSIDFLKVRDFIEEIHTFIEIFFCDFFPKFESIWDGNSFRIKEKQFFYFFLQVLKYIFVVVAKPIRIRIHLFFVNHFMLLLSDHFYQNFCFFPLCFLLALISNYTSQQVEILKKLPFILFQQHHLQDVLLMVVDCFIRLLGSFERLLKAESQQIGFEEKFKLFFLNKELARSYFHIGKSQRDGHMSVVLSELKFRNQHMILMLLQSLNHLITYIFQMGNYCHGEGSLAYESESFNPIKINFKRTHPIALPPIYDKTLDKIGQVAKFVDMRSNVGLKWFVATPLDIYMLGDIENGKPKGQCLFYIKNVGIHEELPVVICTKIEEGEKLSKQTLLLYSDKSYYIGEIVSQNLSRLPKAKGRGMLVTKDFIYIGEFDNGLPHGYGSFKTRSGELTGEFIEGEPHGKCIERSKKGLFVGQLIANYRKNGKLITPNNQVEFVNEEYPIDPKTGHTIVEL